MNVAWRDSVYSVKSKLFHSLFYLLQSGERGLCI